MKEFKSFYVSRRRFIQLTGVAGAAMAMPGSFFAEEAPKKVSQKLKIACVGCGGQGGGDARCVSSEQFTAFCDVDDNRAAKLYAAFPDVPRFKDYRQMFDKMDKDIEAVTVSTPDHSHFQIALEAISRGKHVYVQKPAVQTIDQSIKLLKAARKHKVVTQMGNQGNSNEGTKLLSEWLSAGLIGKVKEVVYWTTKPVWPQGMMSLPEPMPVPDGLDWKLWQAGVTDTPYSKPYLPFDWRGWYSYGTGALGDMGCHIMNATYRALDLRGPCKVSAQIDAFSPVAYPKGSAVTYEFPERNGRPPVKLTWYDGTFIEKAGRPDGLEPGRSLGDEAGGGFWVIGEKAIILCPHDCSSPRIIPETRMQAMMPEIEKIPKTIKRFKGNHYLNWIAACKGEAEACSNLEYAIPLTQLCLIGAVAQRVPGETLNWDGENDFGWFNKGNKLIKNMQPQNI